MICPLLSHAISVAGTTTDRMDMRSCIGEHCAMWVPAVVNPNSYTGALLSGAGCGLVRR